MSAGEINHVSQAIGQLQASVAALTEGQKHTNATLGDISRKLESMNSVASRVDEIAPKVDRLEKSHQRGVGFMAAVAAMGGAAFALFKIVLEKMGVS